MPAIIPEQKIRSWQELEKAFDALDNGNWGFRGVTSTEYDLVPSVGRKSSRKRYSKEWEEEVFDRFKLQAFPYLTKTPPTELAWLAVARHCGLPTRLLDWTLSPWIATYFAVTGPRPDTGDPPDCAVYAFESKFYQTDDAVKDPFRLERTYIDVNAAHYIPRIAAQKGFFTLHREPNTPFRSKTLRKWVIPGDFCDEFQWKLDYRGINRATIFPDLDGIGQHLAWVYRTIF